MKRLLILLAALLPAAPLWPQSYEQSSPEPGDRCIVCGVPLTSEDVVLVVRGRRVPLNQAMVDSFLRHEEQFFSRLQPKGALFNEEMAPGAQGGIGGGWFLFGLYVLAGLVFAGLSAYTAVSRGLPAIRYFFLGLFFNAAGYVYALTRSPSRRDVPAGMVKVPDTKAPARCQGCGRQVHPSAEACPFCGMSRAADYEAEAKRV